jgi:hypothetical protein
MLGLISSAWVVPSGMGVAVAQVKWFADFLPVTSIYKLNYAVASFCCIPSD